VPDDELEKLRSTLVHAYDPPKPFSRRIIDALRRPHVPKKPKSGAETKKTKKAA
jgi:hypothetical protein